MQSIINCVCDLHWLAALTQQEILRQIRADVAPGGLLLQQDPSVYALRHASQEEQMAMLDPLKNEPLVHEAAEEVGQIFIWGVEGQLREGQQRARASSDGGKLLRVSQRCQHVQGVVKVLWLSSQR